MSDIRERLRIAIAERNINVNKWLKGHDEMYEAVRTSELKVKALGEEYMKVRMDNCTEVKR